MHCLYQIVCTLNSLIEWSLLQLANCLVFCKPRASSDKLGRQARRLTAAQCLMWSGECHSTPNVPCEQSHLQTSMAPLSKPTASHAKCPEVLPSPVDASNDVDAGVVKASEVAPVGNGGSSAIGFGDPAPDRSDSSFVSHVCAAA